MGASKTKRAKAMAPKPNNRAERRARGVGETVAVVVPLESFPPTPKRPRKGEGKPRQHTAIPGVPCRCRQCVKARKKPREWPRHYVGIPVRQDRARPSPNAWQSYECHIEGESVDPELIDELAALRNEPERVGSVTVERRRRL